MSPKVALANFTICASVNVIALVCYASIWINLKLTNSKIFCGLNKNFTSWYRIFFFPGSGSPEGSVFANNSQNKA
jgi:hypothetical protein